MTTRVDLPAPGWTTDESIEPLARAFAALTWRANVGRVSHERAVARTALSALLVVERANGHGAVHPDDWAGREAHPDLPGVALPDARAWADALVPDAWIGDGGTPTPLVGRPDGSIALHRDELAERDLAARIRRRLVTPATEPPSAELAATFGRLFDASEATGAALAGAAALRSRFTVVTGGPGTGKTTAVVRILGLLLQSDPSMRVAVAAPTGKAAARLQSSIAERRLELEVDDRVKDALALRVRTVHRLLGYRPHDESFTHDERDPLPFDVVAIDEASMLDLALATALLRAMRDDARLILLGDRDQLASVDAGAVLADVVAAAGSTRDARSADFAAFAAPLFRSTIPVAPTATALSDTVVELRVNHRFKAQESIGRLALALRAGDVDEVVDRLHDAGGAVLRIDPPSDPRALDAVLEPWAEVLGSQDETPDDRLLSAVEKGVRILTATRRGRWGVEGLNATVEAWLRARLGWSTGDPWYRGRPILVGRNVPGLDLSNGDVGVCVADPEDPRRRVVLLRDPQGRLRHLPVSRLPAHETAWAMTVHKSQGSEFDHVVMVLPADRHPLLTRSLLYTGITRAKHSVTVIAREETVRAAVQVLETRRTALASRLAER